jgi:hypothetical protein
LADPDPLASLLPAVDALASWWEEEGIRAAVIGGLAVSLISTPRVTKDIDALAVVPDHEWEALLDGAQRHGFEPRLSDAVEFARQSRVLLLRHGATHVDLDLALGALPFEDEAVQRAVRFQVGNSVLPLASPEDLIIMKILAHRPRDLEDVRAILATHPNPDVERLRYWVSLFAAALEAPDLTRLLEEALAARRTRS